MQLYATTFTESPVSPVAFTHTHSVETLPISSSVETQWHQLVEAVQDLPSHSGWVTLINPPFIPNEQYLNSIGLSQVYFRVIWTYAQTKADATNTLNRCLSNGKSVLVAAWEPLGQLSNILMEEATCPAIAFSHQQASISSAHQMELLL